MCVCAGMCLCMFAKSQVQAIPARSSSPSAVVMLLYVGGFRIDTCAYVYFYVCVHVHAHMSVLSFVYVLGTSYGNISRGCIAIVYEY